MSPEIIGLLMVAAMLFAIFIGFPIAFTLLFLGVVFGYWGFGQLVFYLLTLQFNATMMEQTLAAVPLFVFMGIMMEQANLMERLFDSVQKLLAGLRGSLFLAVMFVATIFAAATGIVGASVTILGIMAGKPMIRSGYDVKLSAGVTSRSSSAGAARSAAARSSPCGAARTRPRSTSPTTAAARLRSTASTAGSTATGASSATTTAATGCAAPTSTPPTRPVRVR